MAVAPLLALVDAGHDIVLCVTRPDRRRGRGGRTTPSPVKEAASALGIPVSHNMDDLTAAGAELAVVVAYGRIIPARLLRELPMVNLHFSLLPRWRGAAPVERAILAGDRETGVCLMQVDEGLDSGPLYATRTVPIDDDVTLDALRQRLVEVASALVVEMLADGPRGLPEPRPQQGEPTIADKITKEDLHLDWQAPATQLKRVVRLGHAWTTFRGKRLTILEAAVADSVADSQADPDRHTGTVAEAGTGSRPGVLYGTAVSTGGGALVLQTVQPESRSPMSADEWLRGARPGEGERLGTD
jgi:methionyl-tRNA formyltransferase